MLEKGYSDGISVKREVPHSICILADTVTPGSESKMLKMHFAGQVAGVNANFLTDTKASKSFMSKSSVAVKKLKTNLVACDKVMLPNG